MTDRHAVLMLAYNTTREQLELTKDAVNSVLAQDIGSLCVHLIDNGSTVTETFDYFTQVQDTFAGVMVTRYKTNESPLKLVNMALHNFFAAHYDKVLGVPNDVVLPPNIYRLMSQCPRGFVTASMNGEKDFPAFTEAKAVSECTPMAVALTRRWAFDALVAKDGYFFDEGYFMYASDCDLALRISACGIRGVQLDIQYYHYGSACWRLATPEVGRNINSQADIDRSYFFKKWGFGVGDERYTQSAHDINFRG